jgi:hypothetical protein
VSDKYLSSEPTDLKSDDSSEQLWVKLQVKGAPDLYCLTFDGVIVPFYTSQIEITP